jgi:hypothetical protein
MSNTELLLKEIEGLPAHYMGEVLDFVGYLKHKAPPTDGAFKENGAPQVPGTFSPRQERGGKPANSLRGILKGKGITIAEFEKMQREDLLLEEGRE